MPFKSAKQKKYLYANKPEVAKKFAEHSKKKAPTKVEQYHESRGGMEIMKEVLGGRLGK